jgi:hypothetical protein
VRAGRCHSSACGRRDRIARGPSCRWMVRSHSTFCRTVTVRSSRRGLDEYHAFPRRGLRPLATAGGVVGLRERRWKPLRRPCGRLSGLRKTLNVIRHISSSCTRHQSGSSCIRTTGRIQASRGSSRRAPPGSSLCRSRPRPRRRTRHALSRGIVRRTATTLRCRAGRFSRFLANQRHENLFSRHGVPSDNSDDRDQGPTTRSSPSAARPSGLSEARSASVVGIDGPHPA